MQRNFKQFLIVGILLCYFQVKAFESDTLKLLRVERLNISANTSNADLSIPTFANYANDFRFGYKFSTNQYSPIEQVEAFSPKTSYTGFQVNFLFRSNLFKDSLSRIRNKLTFAFETGTSEANLYQVIAEDNTRFTYNFKSNTFRLSFGYKHFISKKGRFKFYTGAELINEFNISAAVFEKAYGSSFETSTGERKLFAKKSYNLYLNAPIGFDFRFLKKGSIFFHYNLGFGFENLDPIRIINFYNGTRFGFSLAID